MNPLLADKSQPPHVFICHGGEDPEDLSEAERLGAELAGGCGELAKVECVSVDRLLARYPQGVIPGITLLILSEALAAVPSRCAAFARIQAEHVNQLVFPHFCVCRGAKRPFAGVPELRPLFDHIEVSESWEEAEVLSEIVGFSWLPLVAPFSAFADMRRLPGIVDERIPPGPQGAGGRSSSA